MMAPEPSDSRREREQPSRLAPIDFVALKTQASIEQVLGIIGWKPNARRAGGIELRGTCPVHGSKSETSTVFSVSTEKNVFFCHSCGASGDQFHLACELFGLERNETVKMAVRLCRELGIEVPRK